MAHPDSPTRAGHRTPPARVRLARVVLAAATLLLPCACGLPRDGAATSVPATAVPYNLLSPAPSDASTPTPTERTTAPRLYLVNVEDELVPARTPVAAQGLDAIENLLLERLTAGPTERQRGLGLAERPAPRHAHPLGPHRRRDRDDRGAARPAGTVSRPPAARRGAGGAHGHVGPGHHHGAAHP